MVWYGLVSYGMSSLEGLFYAEVNLTVSIVNYIQYRHCYYQNHFKQVKSSDLVAISMF